MKQSLFLKFALIGALGAAVGGLGPSGCESGDPIADGGADADTDADTDTDTDDDTDDDSDGDSDEECESGIWCIAHSECCAVGEECVSDLACLPICETVRCGPNQFDCCDEEEICLDGVFCAVGCDQPEQLCGTDLDICCEDDEVCINQQCVVPGEPCQDNFGCPDDSYYCEPLYGNCFELPDGELCEGTPDFHEINPELEWKWEGITYQNKLYENVISSPAVGDVTGDGIPEIVIIAYNLYSEWSRAGLVVVLDGRGDGAGAGQVVFTIPSDADADAPMALSSTSVALANFDDDPGLEIVYVTADRGVRIADNDGIGAVCDTATYPACEGLRPTINGTVGPVVADLDHDGMPDVIVNCQALNGRDVSQQALDFTSGTNCGMTGLVADVDLDGKPEVVSSTSAVTVDPAVPGGVELWSANNGSGLLALADVFPDHPGPEIAMINYSLTIIQGMTGQMLVGAGGSVVDSAVAIPGGSYGGSPNIADFDGDGLAEIATAGGGSYVLFDPDCYEPPIRAGQCNTGTTDFILWSQPTQDVSSGMTGSSVFDFQGDGAAEAVYGDECYLRIYDGKTGEELAKEENPSWTWYEYPLVADVDRDGNSEIVVVANKKSAHNCVDYDQAPTKFGIKVFGDTHDKWVRTRPVWPQYHYHITDFEFSGGLWNVPADEEANWLTYNNYRQNHQGGVVLPLPDLTVELQAVPKCPDEIVLFAFVTNQGSAAAGDGVELQFFRTAGAQNELIDSQGTTRVMLPGGFEMFTTSFASPPIGDTIHFLAAINESGATEECDYTNNSDTADGICEDVIVE